MATIKDIAKLAGVSQGTVSNVLNKKGNVSSKKIFLVQKAAEELNYSLNAGAQLLRSGKNNSIALILPNIEDKKNLDFYLSCKSYVLSKEYSLNLFLTNDNPEEEKKIINLIQSTMPSGIITFTCLSVKAFDYYFSTKYTQNEILFVERNGSNVNNFIGFDYYNFFSTYLSENKGDYKSIYLIVDENSAIQELKIRQLLKNKSIKQKIKLIRLSYEFRNIQLLQVFNGQLPDVIIAENENIAKSCKNLIDGEFKNPKAKIYCFTSITTAYKGIPNTIELNYRMLGKNSAKSIILTIQNKAKIKNTYLDINPMKEILPLKKNYGEIKLDVLLLDSPPAYILLHFFKIYSKKTGIKINTDIVSYHDIYDIYDHLNKGSNYDLLRIGAEVFSWYAPKILQPLNGIESDVSDIFDNIIPGLISSFSNIGGIPYAIPISPSIQFCFYRKDLFENIIYKRLFKERYKEELEVPTTFKKYNKIARFFTKSINPSSPTKFGTTLTFGHNQNVVAGSEFMTRYFSYANNIFKGNKLDLDRLAVQKSLDNIVSLKDCIDVPRNWWTEPARDINNGNVVMTILYSNFASDFYSKNSKIANKLGFGMIPGGNPLLGGGSLGVSKYSKYPNESLSLIRWLSSKPIAEALAYYSGAPITKDTLKNYEIIDLYPWLSLFEHQLNSLSYKRISDNFCFYNDKKFTDLLGRSVLKYYYKEKNFDDVFLSIHEEYEKEKNNLYKIVE